MAINGELINRCPPGGDATIRELAQLLGRPVIPLDSGCGPHEARIRVVIDEAVCIGCRKCIDACPVDAIIGARKWMHTVLTDECNGCALCIPACPVDCIATSRIDLAADPESLWPEYARAEANRWRARAEIRLQRIANNQARVRRERAGPTDSERRRMRAEIQAAVERVRHRRRPS